MIFFIYEDGSIEISYTVVSDDCALSGGSMNWSSNSNDSTPHIWEETNGQSTEKLIGKRGLLLFLLSVRSVSVLDLVSSSSDFPLVYISPKLIFTDPIMGA